LASVAAWVGVLCPVLAVLLFSMGSGEFARSPARTSSGARARALAAYTNLPLSFVRNGGQIGAPAGFYARGAGFGFLFTRREALLTFARRDRGLTLGLHFLSSSASLPIGRQRLPGTVNELHGSTASRWRTGLPTFGKAVYHNLWPGIDLAFRGASGRLEYSFVVRPGARPSQIGLAYRGARSLRLDPTGSLRIQTPLGSLTNDRPVTYQAVAGRKTPVASRFVLRGGTSFGFEVGHYDASRTLVIDDRPLPGVRRRAREARRR
jgi:hypothetical protein